MRFQVIRLLTLVVSVAMVALVGAFGTASIASAQPPGQVKKQNTVDMVGKDDAGNTVFTGTFTATGPVRPNSGNSDLPMLVTGQLKGKVQGAGLRGQGQGPQGQGQGTSPVQQQVEMPAAATVTPGSSAIRSCRGESRAGRV